VHLEPLVRPTGDRRFAWPRRLQLKIHARIAAGQRIVPALPIKGISRRKVLRVIGPIKALGLDLDDLPTTQRRCRLRVRGPGRRTAPSWPIATDGRTRRWIAERRMWPGADTAAVFLDRVGARLPLRTADEIIRTIIIAAGLADVVTPHALRHSFARPHRHRHRHRHRRRASRPGLASPSTADPERSTAWRCLAGSYG
jgi:integrase